MQTITASEFDNAFQKQFSQGVEILAVSHWSSYAKAVHRVISVAIVAIALACNGHRDEPPPPPVQRDLTLISSGLPPLAPLHYAIAKGTKTSLAMDVITHVVAAE